MSICPGNSRPRSVHRGSPRLRVSASLAPVWLLIALLCFAKTAFGGAGDDPLVLTRDEAISLALERNLQLVMAKRELGRADARIMAAKAGALPMLTVDAMYTRNWTRASTVFTVEYEDSLGNPVKDTRTVEFGTPNVFQTRVNLNQPLYQGGRVGAALEVADLFSELSRENVASAEEELIFRVESAFYGALLASQTVDAAKIAVDLADAHLDQVEKLHAEGAAAEYDLLRAKVHAANLRPVLIEAVNRQKLSIEGLKIAIGLDLSREISTRGEFEEPSEAPPERLEEAERIARDRRSEFKQMDLQIGMQEHAITIARGNSKLSAYLTNSYQLQWQLDELRFDRKDVSDSWVTGVSVQIPVFDGWRTKALVRQAKVDLQQTKDRRRLLEDGIRLEVRRAMLSIEEAWEKIISQRRTIEQAERGLRIGEVRYENGIATQLEVLDAQLALTQARTNHLRALYEYSIARVNLRRATGNMRSERRP